MATFCLSGRPSANDTNADTIVTPALGPSLGVAPCDLHNQERSSDVVRTKLAGLDYSHLRDMEMNVGFPQHRVSFISQKTLEYNNIA